MTPKEHFENNWPLVVSIASSHRCIVSRWKDPLLSLYTFWFSNKRTYMYAYFELLFFVYCLVKNYGNTGRCGVSISGTLWYFLKLNDGEQTKCGPVFFKITFFIWTYYRNSTNNDKWTFNMSSPGVPGEGPTLYWNRFCIAIWGCFSQNDRLVQNWIQGLLWYHIRSGKLPKAIFVTKKLLETDRIG